MNLSLFFVNILLMNSCPNQLLYSAYSFSLWLDGSFININTSVMFKTLLLSSAWSSFALLFLFPPGHAMIKIRLSVVWKRLFPTTYMACLTYTYSVVAVCQISLKLNLKLKLMMNKANDCFLHPGQVIYAGKKVRYKKRNFQAEFSRWGWLIVFPGEQTSPYKHFLR